MTNSNENQSTQPNQSQESIDIQGISLEIDKDINEICEVSNSTSSSTRSVMYILTLVCILSLTAAMNTSRYFNWNKYRLKTLGEELNYFEKEEDKLNQLKKQPKTKSDSSTVAEMILVVKDSIQLTKDHIAMIQRNHIENFRTVKMPILGNAFDVNNLGLVSGVTIIVLLFILGITIDRELDNLRIALKAVTERYKFNSDSKTFDDIIKSHFLNYEKVDVLHQINTTRRKHHYNFLTMNELFNDPPLPRSSIKIKPGKIRQNASSKEGEKQLSEDKTATNLTKMERVPLFYSRFKNCVFLIPALVFMAICVNDYLTLKNGMHWSSNMTKVSSLINLVSFVLIGYLSYKCTTLKKRLYFMYVNFSKNNFEYKEFDVTEIQQSPDKKIELLFKATYCLAIILYISFHLKYYFL